MLEYAKIILEKVSFDKGLFEKELKKAIDTLEKTEVKTLCDWCYQQFFQYLTILNKYFRKLRTAY